MALSGIQILKLLPRTNCGECGVPTCLAFAMSLAQGKAELGKCPHVSEEGKAALSAASAPPIRTVALGAGGNRPQIGGETVLFRHEKTFVNKTALGVLLDETMSEADVQARIDRFNAMRIVRVGLTLRPEIIAVRATSAEKLGALADLAAAKTDAALVLMSADVAALTAVATKHKDRKPLLYAATADNVAALGELAKKLAVPVAVRASGIDAVAEITKKLESMGVQDIVIDPGPADMKTAYAGLIHTRRAAIQSKVKEVGYPTLFLPFELTGDIDLQTLYTSVGIAKYASAIIMSDIPGHALFPLLLERLNVYTDPQRPMKTEEGIYPLNNPGPDSPVLVTCNFSLTYFIITGEVETSRVPAWLFVKDTEGLSVLTSWAAGKFSGDDIGIALKKAVQVKGIELTKRDVVIPGMTAVISGDLEEELGAGWTVKIGPREGGIIPSYLRQSYGG
jgi:acetyl-CoA decarbonylase/synthase complex subunit gamma